MPPGSVVGPISEESEQLVPSRAPLPSEAEAKVHSKPWCRGDAVLRTSEFALRPPGFPSSRFAVPKLQ
eukprot:5162283-Alexandrium_andersonii.AAC.1